MVGYFYLEVYKVFRICRRRHAAQRHLLPGFFRFVLRKLICKSVVRHIVFGRVIDFYRRVFVACEVYVLISAVYFVVQPYKVIAVGFFRFQNLVEPVRHVCSIAYLRLRYFQFAVFAEVACKYDVIILAQGFVLAPFSRHRIASNYCKAVYILYFRSHAYRYAFFVLFKRSAQRVTGRVRPQPVKETLYVLFSNFAIDRALVAYYNFHVARYYVEFLSYSSVRFCAFKLYVVFRILAYYKVVCADVLHALGFYRALFVVVYLYLQIQPLAAYFVLRAGNLFFAVIGLRKHYVHRALYGYYRYSAVAEVYVVVAQYRVQLFQCRFAVRKRYKVPYKSALYYVRYRFKLFYILGLCVVLRRYIRAVEVVVRCKILESAVCVYKVKTAFVFAGCKPFELRRQRRRRRAVAGVHFFILCRYVQLFLCYYKRLLVIRKLVVSAVHTVCKRHAQRVHARIEDFVYAHRFAFTVSAVPYAHFQPQIVAGYCVLHLCAACYRVVLSLVVVLHLPLRRTVVFRVLGRPGNGYILCSYRIRLFNSVYVCPVYAERIVRRIQRYACVVCFSVRVRVCAVLAVGKLNFQCYALPRHVCIVRIGHLLTAVILECIRAPYNLNRFSCNVEVERCRVCRKLKIVIHGRCYNFVVACVYRSAHYAFAAVFQYIYRIYEHVFAERFRVRLLRLAVIYIFFKAGYLRRKIRRFVPFESVRRGHHYRKVYPCVRFGYCVVRVEYVQYCLVRRYAYRILLAAYIIEVSIVVLFYYSFYLYYRRKRISGLVFIFHRRTCCCRGIYFLVRVAFVRVVFIPAHRKLFLSYFEVLRRYGRCRELQVLV